MAKPKSPATPNYSAAKDAKELLDLIGAVIQKEAHNAADEYRAELQGHLSSATFPTTFGNEKPPSEPCDLNYDKDTNVTHTVTYPCENRSSVRFSDEGRGQCTQNRIKDSTSDNVGACAPFRRLNLCDTNLELMKSKKITTTHNLLVDVLLAAKYEGQSITGYYPRYQAKYGDPGSTICTVLARSFADIGDIIRGKDLYLGYDQREKSRRQQLENKLKNIFKQIHDKLAQQKKGAQEHYKDTENYYQLREDWWNANRRDVWKAITCGAPDSSQYETVNPDGTRKTCTRPHCRCINGDPPTNLDYVPQYLRWFEEWAEDFCRKRKHKLENAKKFCGDNSKDLYCSRNGFDCKETVRGREIFVKGVDCHNCSVVCTPFVDWIDNQKLEFLKQKEKYTKEIQKYANETKGTPNGKINNIYEKEFYTHLQRNYRSVNEFLELLSKERACQKNHEVGNEKETCIDFKNRRPDEIFSHTKYCQPCPICGVEKVGPPWKPNPENCDHEKIKDLDDSNGTEINLLVKNKSGTNMMQKLKDLCSKGAKRSFQKETWKCYYEKDNENKEGSGKDYCVLQDDKKDDPQHRTIMPFGAFFSNWINEMLKDSIVWRKELDNCKKNEDESTCKNKQCKKNCECFNAWVEQKNTEWGEIEKRYEKEDFQGWGPYGTLEMNLALNYFPIIEEANKDEKPVQEMKEIIERNYGNITNCTRDNNSINEFLQREKDAETCQQNEEECTPKKQKPNKPNANSADVARADHGTPKVVVKQEDGESGDEDEEEEAKKCQKCEKPQETNRGEGRAIVNPTPVLEEEEEEEEDDDEGSEVEDDDSHNDGDDTQQESSGDTGPSGEVPPEQKENICEIVGKILTDDTLIKACPTKYKDGKERFTQWYCGGKTTEGSGSICVPPRRRKLYIQKIIDWADQVATQEANSQVTEGVSQGAEPTPGAPASTSSSSDPTTQLRDAFIQSAAVETWFLWYSYNKIKEKEIQEKKQRLNGGISGLASMGIEVLGGDSDDENPQTKLESGEIPDDFLRQMFYTLGDYRDILVGNLDSDVREALKKSVEKTKPSGTETYKVAESGDEDIMKKIDDAINKHIDSLNNGTPGQSRPNPQPNTVTSREKLWEEYREPVWNGMVCALTYKEENSSITVDTNVKENLLDTANGKKTPKEKYTYEQAELEAAGATEALGKEASSTAHHGTPLKNFVATPTFFRWLHEWGNEFCLKRTHNLEQVRKACREKDGGGDTYCSGDGHNCTDNDRKFNKMLHDLECPDCHKECMKYRKWIYKKFEEFHEQNNIYERKFGELKDNSENDDYEKYYNELDQKNLSTAANFLNALKHCKDGQSDTDKGPEYQQNNKIDFGEPVETFGRSTYCKTCPPQKVNCNGGKPGNDPCKQINDSEKRWKNVFDEIGGNGTDKINVDMIDRRWPFIKNYSKDSLDSLFTSSRLFRGFRKQTWTCKFENENKDVCHFTNFKDEIDLNQYTTFKVLIVNWLEDFLYGYYLLKKKNFIKQCTEKGDNTCDGKSEKNCVCAKKWVEKKKEEWKQIQECFHKKYNGVNAEMKSSFRGFLETLITRMDVNKTSGSSTDLVQLEKSLGCNCTARSQNTEDSDKKDIVECIHEYLDKKIKIESCPTIPSDSPEASCQNSSSLLPDDEEELESLEGETTTNTAPQFCEIEEEKPEPVEEDNCKAAPTTSKEPAPTTPKEPAPTSPKNTSSTTGGEQLPKVENPSQKPEVIKPEEEAPAPEIDSGGGGDRGTQGDQSSPPAAVPKKDKKVIPPPPRVDKTPNDYKLTDVLLPSAFPWTVGVAFVALSYWWLMKKKTTSPVDLFSVMEIPQNDYGMPNLKSTNRYVPYKSAKYRGKRYIYLEGDSGPDSGYTDHYSDITSSSESEYEEMDLHVPHVPKYKTLIEVILEPSTSGKNAPTSGNNIPSDDTPTPITDDEWNQLKQNFISQYLQNIQNDMPNILPDNIDNNTHPNTLYDNVDQKPFIMSIHDRNLYTGEEYSYDMINSGENYLYSDIGRISGNLGSYSGIDLINDSLNSGNQPIDIYDEMLKRKENELFGTKHHPKKNTYSVAKHTNSDPIECQLNLFHKWLDRHRNMCEKWDKNKKEELLDKLKEEWENDTSTSGKLSGIPNNTIHSSDIHLIDIRSGKLSDIPSGKHVLNSDVSIRIDMDNKLVDDIYMDSNRDKSTMDTILDDLEKYNDPYYYDIYENDKPSVDDNIYVDNSNMEKPTKIQIEMDVNNHKLMKEKYPIADIWDI